MRYDDSPELFGVGCGRGTSGDIECDICKAKYNQGADDAEDYHSRDTVNWTDFAGLTVCDCCFERIEEEMWNRRKEVLEWLTGRINKNMLHYQECLNIIESKGELKNKIITDHPFIKEYQERMRREKRCDQCISPWNDGLCECGKAQKNKIEISSVLTMTNALNQIGWVY